MRIEQLTVTRFFAAIAIVIFHFGTHVFPFDQPGIVSIFKRANVAVSYFFMLSGLVLMVSYGNQATLNTRSYLKGRFARIYPVFFLSVMLLFAFKFLTGPVNYPDVLINLTLFQSWVPVKAVVFNYPAWSLSVEVFFYLLFPFLFKYVYFRIPLKKLAAAILIFWLLSQVCIHLFIAYPIKGFTKEISYLVYYFPLLHLNAFIAGNLAGLFLLRTPITNRKNFDLAVLFLFFLTGLTLIYPPRLFLHNGLLAVLFAPLLIITSLNKGLLTRIAKMRLSVFLGEISFGIYIFQVPVFTWMAGIFHQLHVTNAAVHFYVSLGVLIIISGLSFIYIERPVASKIKSLTFGRMLKLHTAPVGAE